MTRHKILASLVACAVALPVLALADPADQRHEPGHEMAAQHDRHDWHKGERLPTSYRDHRNEVTDWRSHNLRQPPRGYHWVNVDGQFVLAAIATGIVADVLLNQ